MPDAPLFHMRRCEDCGYLASAQGQRAVLEALLEHQMWKAIREMHRAVFPEMPAPEEKKASA